MFRLNVSLIPSSTHENVVLFLNDSMHEMLRAVHTQAGEELSKGVSDLVGSLFIQYVGVVVIIPLRDGNTSGSVLIIRFPSLLCTIWEELDPILELSTE